MLHVIDNKIFIVAHSLDDIDLLMHLCHLEDYNYIVIDVCGMEPHISILGCVREMMNQNKNVLFIYDQDVLDDKVDGIHAFKNKQP
jgi:hypothetical protein